MEEIYKIFGDKFCATDSTSYYALGNILSGVIGKNGPLNKDFVDCVKAGIMAVYDHATERGYDTGKAEGRHAAILEGAKTHKIEFDRGHDLGYAAGKAEAIKETEEGVNNMKATFERSFDDHDHPLMKPFREAVTQATSGKGEERHGRGADFMAQPWVSLAKTHGRGFLTGQAAKKLDEAQHFDNNAAWRKEMLGAMVYIGMALIEDDRKNMTFAEFTAKTTEAIAKSLGVPYDQLSTDFFKGPLGEPYVDPRKEGGTHRVTLGNELMLNRNLRWIDPRKEVILGSDMSVDELNDAIDSGDSAVLKRYNLKRGEDWSGFGDGAHRMAEDLAKAADKASQAGGLMSSTAAAEFAVRSKVLAKTIDEVNGKRAERRLILDINGVSKLPDSDLLKFMWKTVPDEFHCLTRDKFGAWNAWKSRPSYNRKHGHWVLPRLQAGDRVQFVAASPVEDAPYEALLYRSITDDECGK